VRFSVCRHLQKAGTARRIKTHSSAKLIGRRRPTTAFRCDTTIKTTRAEAA